MGFSRSIFNSVIQRPEQTKKYVYVSLGASMSKYTTDGQLVMTGPAAGSSIINVVGVMWTDAYNDSEYLYGTRWLSGQTIYKMRKSDLFVTASTIPVPTGYGVRVMDTGRDNLYFMWETFSFNSETANKYINLVSKSTLKIIATFSSSTPLNGVVRFPKLMYKTDTEDVFVVGAALSTNNNTNPIMAYRSDNSTYINEVNVDSGNPRACYGIVYDKFGDHLVFSRVAGNSSNKSATTIVKKGVGTISYPPINKTLTTNSKPFMPTNAVGDTGVGSHQSIQTSNGDIIYRTPYPTPGVPPLGLTKIYRKTWDNFYADTNTNIFSITPGSFINQMSIDDYDNLYVSDRASTSVVTVKKYNQYGDVVWGLTFSTTNNIFAVVSN
jgi:hypothetical protein